MGGGLLTLEEGRSCDGCQKVGRQIHLKILELSLWLLDIIGNGCERKVQATATTKTMMMTVTHYGMHVALWRTPFPAPARVVSLFPSSQIGVSSSANGDFPPNDPRSERALQSPLIPLPTTKASPSLDSSFPYAVHHFDHDKGMGWRKAAGDEVQRKGTQSRMKPDKAKQIASNQSRAKQSGNQASDLQKISPDSKKREEVQRASSEKATNGVSAIIFPSVLIYCMYSTVPVPNRSLITTMLDYMHKEG